MTRTGQLDQISEAIGSMRADVKHLHECTHELRSEVKAMRDEVGELQKLRAKGGGILLGISMVSGLFGHFAGKLIGH